MLITSCPDARGDLFSKESFLVTLVFKESDQTVPNIGMVTMEDR